jgi:YVTN family beta-propeller protein
MEFNEYKKLLPRIFAAAKGNTTMKFTNSARAAAWSAVLLAALTLTSQFAIAQTPSPALLVLEKADASLAIVDPSSLQVVSRVPAGPDPHEIVASPDGKLAYISNYGGSDSTLNTVTVVDLAARKALPPIDLGALRSAHGLVFAGGKLYFTVETNKAIGRYDPATQSVDWVLGTGQDRTHMIVVSESLDRIITSNVSSGTVSIIEQGSLANGGFNPPPSGNGPPPPAPPAGAPRKTWRVTNVPAGHGSEGFDVSPDGKEIWVANAQDATVTIIDVASKKVSQTLPISLKGANRLKMTPDGKRVVIAGFGTSTGANLVVFDAVSHKEVKQINLGGPSSGVLIVPDGSRAYVAVSAKNKVAVVDLNTLEVTGEVQVGKQPDGLAWAQAK